MSDSILQNSPITIEIAKLIRLNPGSSPDWFKTQIRKVIGDSEFNVNKKYPDHILIRTETKFEDFGKGYKEHVDTYELEKVEFKNGINGPWTLLAYAACCNNTSAVKALFDLGAKNSVAFGYRQEWSNFQWAIYNKNFVMLDMFRENGADLSDFDGMNFTHEKNNSCSYNWSPIGNAIYNNCLDKAIMHGLSPIAYTDSVIHAASWGNHLNRLFQKIESGKLDLTGSVLHRDFVLLAEKAGIEIDRSAVTLSGEAHGENVIEHFYQLFIHNKEGNFSNKKPGTYTLDFEAFKKALAKDVAEQEVEERLEEAENNAQTAYEDSMKAAEAREKQEEEALSEISSGLAGSIIDQTIEETQSSTSYTNPHAELETTSQATETHEVPAAGDGSAWQCVIL